MSFSCSEMFAMKVRRFAGLTICLLALFPLSLAVAEDCQKLHNVTRSQVEALAPNIPVSEVPLNIKCYSRCVLGEYIGSDGKIDLKLVGNRPNADELRVLVQCKQRLDDVSDRENCDYAYLMQKCLDRN